ncbi:AT-hook motif nuclear-localized protein 1-like [Zingiber officinale]|uniref:AT-hook motif nuclear-localized protein 1-like n=1 Tax=Zingiber officinale TaxID=94328 RepID=UPI001C4DB410|nr:AT-hook motif nuclear-localized protein 1-like [Zingiber officinale]
MELREGGEGVVPSPAEVEAVAAVAEGSGSYQQPPPPPATLALEADASREKKPAKEVGGAAAAATIMATTAGGVVGPSAAAGGETGEASGLVKKKRGRPRKYGPDGTPLRPLNPMPISASAPAGVQYTSAAAVGAVMKRGRGRAVGSVGSVSKTSSQFSLQVEHLSSGGFPEQTAIAGEMVNCSAGANFSPHIIVVAAGEDVTMKIISFSQQGPRAICILSANGIISNVTLRQPDSSGGTLTYEGRFELLSLSGSFMPTENGGTRSRSGGLSVSLASPDGRVIGGGVAGLLVAASPVQVVVGSFLPSFQMEHKTKKSGLEAGSVSTPASAIPLSRTNMEEEALGSRQAQPSSVTAKPGSSTTPGFTVENWSPRSSPMDINISLPGG